MTTEKPRKSEHRFSLTRTVDRECLEEKDRKSIGIRINYAPNCNDCTSTEQVMRTRTLTGESKTFPDREEDASSREFEKPEGSRRVTVPITLANFSFPECLELNLFNIGFIFREWEARS